MIPIHLRRDLAQQHATDLQKLGAARARRPVREKPRLQPTRRAPRRLLARRRLILDVCYAAAQR